MAGIWDRIKALFGGSTDQEAASNLEARVRGAALRRMNAGTNFTALDLAADVIPSPGDRTDEAVDSVCEVVDRLDQRLHFARFAYARTAVGTGAAAWLYHPAARPPSPAARASATAAAAPRAPAAPPASARASAASPPSRGGSLPTPVAASPVASAPYRTAQNPFAAPNLLALSPEEFRRRALAVKPYSTAWIGRTDTIPPQSDTRTALIDRGLVLRGLLTEPQLAEIHRVGDLWLHKHEAVRMAHAAGAAAGDAALAAERAARRAKREEKKRAAALRAQQRAAAIAKRRAEDIVFLGAGVSARLGDRRANVEKLRDAGLPVLATPAEIALALGVSIPRLRWLCFHGDAVERAHYVYFQVPKRSGGMRLLAAPHKSLAAAQQWVLANILSKLPTEPPAHGFVSAHSTVTNALPHVGRALVVNLDLSDFFPTVTFPRVRGIFERLGYSPAAATVFALLCTESPRREVAYEGKRYWVAIGPRALPQGACTSPALSNQVTRKLDRRLAGMVSAAGWTYTRYADDLTFSADKSPVVPVPQLLARVKSIVTGEGFVVHPKKGRIQRAAGRQTVTGVVVNDRTSVPREEVRRLRAILHQARTRGLAAQNREGRPHFEAYLRGKIAYVQMVDRAKGEALMRALDAVLDAQPAR